MSKENPSFLDRVQSVSHNYLNETQRTTTAAQREFAEIGVTPAFQELISSNTILSERFSDKPTHIEYIGGSKPGCYLVFFDKTSYREAKDADDCSEFTYSKKAIGIESLGLKYKIGYFYISTHQKTDEDYWWAQECGGGVNIATKLVDKHEVLDTLAKLVFVFKHNQEEEKNKNPNYLKFP